MLSGGLAWLTKLAGIIHIPNKDIKSKIGSNGYWTLVGLTNLAIANNTVSIVITELSPKINDDMI
jgi:hypothetical protein